MLCVCECEKNLIFINAEIVSVNSIDKKKQLFFLSGATKMLYILI